jgi:hypothetical protein
MVDGEYLLARKGKQGASLRSLLVFGFGKGTYRDETAPLLKGIAPHEIVELVAAALFTGFGLRGCPFLPIKTSGNPQAIERNSPLTMTTPE